MQRCYNNRQRTENPYKHSTVQGVHVFVYVAKFSYKMFFTSFQFQLHAMLPPLTVLGNNNSTRTSIMYV